MARERHLMTVDELSAALAAGRDLVICDCRWYLGGKDARAVYDEGHLPGARFVDLDRDLSSPVREGGAGGRHPLPEPEAFAATLARLGIGPSTTVVAYDDRSGAIAARLWWLLRWVGHEGGRVLDGGIDAWTAAGQPLSTEAPSVTPAERMTLSPQAAMVVNAAAVAGRSEGTLLLDARAPERFRGEKEPVDPRAGHIPGAVNLPWPGNVADGVMAGDQALGERFAAATAADEVIAYCGSGVTACHDLLALAVLGHEDAKLYPGSWSDWSSDPDRPLET